MADKFESFNRQAEQLQQYPMLSGQALDDRFRQVDRLLDKGVRVLLETTHFVEDNLCYRLAEIVIGSIKAKIYRGLYVRERHGAGQGITVGAQNSKILASGFDLFKLSRTSRDLAVPLVLRVLRSLRLQNINYEQILRAFAVLTKDYRGICDRLALQQQYLKQAEERNDPDLILRMQLISNLIDQKEIIESRCGCMNANVLYGTVALIHRYLLRVDRVQDEIIQAYMRSVPRVVREFAKSDLDALDMFQAGCIGLMHAVKAYDFRSRAGFARFSRYWIRQRIRLFMKESGGPQVRLPPNVWEDYQRFTRTERYLNEQRPGEPALRSDVADELGWSIDKVEGLIESVSMCQLVNLDDDTATDGDEFIEREATIADTREEDLELLQQQQEQVSNIVQNLSAEDRRLICLRFGCVELIENDRLDAVEVLEEMFRQLACKTLVHQFMAERIDTVQSMPIEDDVDESVVKPS